MASTILKAVRTPIDIAGILVQGLMVPSGTYRMSDTDIAGAIDEPANSISNNRRTKGFKALLSGDSAISQKPIKTKIEGYNKPVNASSIEFAAAYWVLRSGNNPKAFALSMALATETIQRRFDRAFGVKVSEAEYDESLALRLQRLTARHDWTDVIRDRMIKQGYYHDKIRVQAEFKALTVAVNIRLFNQPHFCCDRDNMNPEQQQLIGDFERAAKRKAIQMPDAPPAALVDAALLIF